MQRRSEKSAGPPALAALIFAVGGLIVAFFTAQSNPTSWDQSLRAAFWILLSSSIVSAVFASISLSMKMTWYSVFLTTICMLYAGVVVIFAVAFSLR